jgi:hypothetical protein
VSVIQMSAFQVVVGAMCAAATFGMILTLIAARGKLIGAGDTGIVYDIAFTDRIYLIGSVLVSLGAIAVTPDRFGVFATLVGAAISLQIAEHFLLPRMKQAADAGQPVPFRGTRRRFELMIAITLMLVFTSLTLPPLQFIAARFGL